MNPKLPRETASAIWTVLVEEAGVSRDEPSDTMFLHAQERGCTEYRFCGALGFGGKFWNNAGRWYVTCYLEDETAQRQVVIDRTNGRLAALKKALDNR